jgi:hypothetical protein
MEEPGGIEMAGRAEIQTAAKQLAKLSLSAVPVYPQLYLWAHI